MSQMWFGNKRKMVWVPCPAVGGGYQKRGSYKSLDLSNGGAVGRLTMSAAQSYSLSWALAPSVDIRKITDFAEGVYGPGHIYWSDPFAMDQNVLSQVFATPSLGAYDGPILSGDTSRPSVSGTPTNDYNLPVEQATYTLKSTSTPLKHWVPIPPGHTAWIGAYGTASGANVRVQPTKGGSNFGSAITFAPAAVNATNRWPRSVSSATGADGIDLSLGGVGTITLAGLAVRVLPTGFTPEHGLFIAGRGHSGCTFTGHPSVEAYSAALDLQGLSAEFVEVAPWQF